MESIETKFDLLLHNTCCVWNWNSVNLFPILSQRLKARSVLTLHSNFKCVGYISANISAWVWTCWYTKIFLDESILWALTSFLVLLIGNPWGRNRFAFACSCRITCLDRRSKCWYINVALLEHYLTKGRCFEVRSSWCFP